MIRRTALFLLALPSLHVARIDAQSVSLDEMSRTLMAAQDAWNEGDIDRTRELITPAIDALSKAQRAGEDLTRAVILLEPLAELAEWVGVAGRARSARRMVVKALVQDLGEDHPDTARARVALAATQMTEGGQEAAEKQLERALTVLEPLPPEPASALAHTLTAEIRMSRGDAEGAAALFRRVLRDHPQVTDENFAALKRARRGLSSTLWNEGNVSEARREFETIAAMFETVGETETGDYLATLHNLALAELADGDPASAVPHFERAADGRRGSVSWDNPARLKVAEDLATALLELGRFDDAVVLAENVAELDARGPSERAQRLVTWSRALAGLGDQQAAKRHLDRALAKLTDEPFLDSARYWRAVQLTAAGEWEQARGAWAQLEGSDRRVREARCAFEAGDLEGARSLASELRSGALSDVDRVALANAEALDALRRGAPERARELGLESTSLDGDPRSLAVARTLLAWSLAQLGETEALAALLPELAGATEDPAGRPDPWLVGSFLYFNEKAGGDDADCLRAFGVDLAPAEIAGRLGPATAAVSYHVHREWVVDRPDLEYVTALVVRPDGSVTRIDVGELAPIDDLVRRWHRACAGGEAGERELGDELRGALLDPLAEAIGDAGRLVIAADGVLGLVPFGSLPWDEERVMDRLGVVHEASLDLVAGEESLLDVPTLGIFGSPKWAARGDLEEFYSATHVHTQRMLADARSEVAGLKTLYRERFGTEPLVWTKDDASHASLVEGAPRVQQLYVSTYDFLGPDAPARRWDVLATSTDPPVGLGLERVGGLQLAGYNWGRDTTGRFPGRILADGIADLELGNCELVVLPNRTLEAAPQRAAEAIRSLEQAFRQAGAGHLVHPTWSVDLEAARALLQDFLSRRWKGATIEDAWRAAVQTARDGGAPFALWGAWKVVGS